jgi:hypothetical protein
MSRDKSFLNVSQLKCVLSECQGSQAAFCRCYSYDIEEVLMKGFIKISNLLSLKHAKAL